MGKLFDEFMSGKAQWKSIAKRSHYRQLLIRAVTTEHDVPVKTVLDVLVAALESNFLAPPTVYNALAARGKAGWLAAEGRKAVTEPNKWRRMEAARWLQYGQMAGKVSKEDVGALRILLLDKDEDVRTVATFPLSSMAADNPDFVAGSLISWSNTLLPGQLMPTLAALAPAWACDRNRELFAMQESVLANPKQRFQFVVLLDHAINRQPVSLQAAEAGWDQLLAPAIARLISGDWKPAPVPNQDIALVRILGKLLALWPVPALIRRAEEQIQRLATAANKQLPPTEIIVGPQRNLGDLASVVWPDYRKWWEGVLKSILTPAHRRTWRDDLKECEAGLRELANAKVPVEVRTENLGPFQKSALEFFLKQKRGEE